ncbi:hypothetical protein CF15_08365 [Pyrodictium occultum]|uniref:Glycosyltransferase subfamily 4-like N-terminal domain-containing protein n=1 Tax=Pyrodictium occultum TaxID=2309 RepID=A0A0V8RSA7_PYROC|nr:glycosyltransferase [Pyrodictium occultum]KSW10778.1 hypothetical protein CF15_08365 [Pyrodictium occultum]
MKRLVFVAWARLSRRTRDLARALGAGLLFLRDRPPYIRAWRETARALEEARPDAVVVQLPQGPLLLRVATLAGRLGFRVVADVHTGFLVYSSPAGLLLNRPFRGLLRRADLVLAHNEPEARLLGRAGLPGERVLVVYDPLPRPPARLERPALDLGDGGYILVPASWAPDEPLELVARGFLASGAPGGYRLVVTGDPGRRPGLHRRLRRLARESRGSIVLTGFLPEPQYAWLLSHAAAVVAATTREYTMLSAAWEAVAYRKPLLASATGTLREVLGPGYPCLFPPTVEGVAEAIDRCLSGGPGVAEAVEETLERLRRMSTGSLERLARILERL